MSLSKVTLIDGSKGKLGMKIAAEEWRDQQHVVTRCLVCPMLHRGTAAEGRAWHEEHRKKKHPKMLTTARVSSKAQRLKAIKDSDWKRQKLESL